MTSFESVTIEVADTAAATAFYTALGLGAHIDVRASEEPTTGFRGFALSLVAAQPGDVDALIGAALDAGATTLKPATKSFWGYGGVIQAPDGTICKVASSKKKDSAPAARKFDQVALLLGVADVKASKRFYVDRASPPGRATAASTPSSTPRRRPSRSPSTRAAPSPRTSASTRTAPARTASSWSAAASPSPTRTASPGRPRPPEAAPDRTRTCPKTPEPARRRRNMSDYQGFTADERAAMKEHAKEQKKAARRASREEKAAEAVRDVLAKIAEMRNADRVMAERVHAVITANAPSLAPKLWYGMPAYALDGKVVCFFQSAEKFKPATPRSVQRPGEAGRRRDVGVRIRPDRGDARGGGADRRTREAGGELRRGEGGATQKHHGNDTERTGSYFL